MWFYELTGQNISNASMVLCKCGKWISHHQRHTKRRKQDCERYRIGRFQCSLCMRRFPEKYRLSDHQRSTCHNGINELESDIVEDSFDKLLSSLYGMRISRISSAFSGMKLTMSSDIYTITRDQLETFIADNIQSDSLFKGCCGEVINQLVLKLQADSAPGRLKPRRIIKTGSLGKGTAVKGRADVDLVMMLAEYDNVPNLMGDLDDLLDQLEKYLVSKTTARHLRTTRYSVQVEVTCTSGHKHDADILPAVDLLELGFTPEEVYKKMEKVRAHIIHEYSVTLSPLQLEIIGALPTKVKNLIKLVKYWKNGKLKERDEPEMPSFDEKRHMKPNWPNSYALELVVINAWSEAKGPTDFDIVRALHAVLTSLVNHSKFEVVLHRQMKYSQDMLKPRSPPFIMDPANPFNDIYHGLIGGKAFDWDRVVPEARRWLGKALFDGVSGTGKNW